MMERRIIVTAIVRKEWTPIKRRLKRAVKNIVVLLGNPRKMDPLKPYFAFDDDDFYTIDQMKAALRDGNSYSKSRFYKTGVWSTIPKNL